MRAKGLVTTLWMVALVTMGTVAPAAAAEPYSYTLGILGGSGGSIDADPGIGYDNLALQMNLGFVVSPQTHLVARLGQLDLDDERGFAGLYGADLTYLSVAGEYRYSEPLYESGLFLGLGAYQLKGHVLGESIDDTALGMHFGITGDFRLNANWSFVAELSAHWADLDENKTFALGHMGLAYHF
ncbi:MAG: hypothetical protein K8J08_01290 [Thermoanaerobaculia bacterium]|nr:hypothetical protein [Thermoanaerobaculia bacterium]